MYLSLFIAGLCLLSATAAVAQGMSEPPADARLQWGPLTLRPTVTFVTGVDTNVLNEETNPTQDYYSRTTPEVQAWLKIGRAQLQVRGGVGAVYFARTDSYRSVNIVTDARLDIDLYRVVPYVSGGFLRTRDRVGFEIDSRPLRIEPVVRGGIVGRLGRKTDLVVGVYQTTTGYGEDETFEGNDLRLLLNRTRRGATAGFRHRLTPLTTIAVTAEGEQDRFEFTPLRDADSLKLLPSVEFQPDALISGSAAVGVRQFRPRSSAVPAFTGLIMALDLSYLLRGSTRFSVGTNRDVTYSFEPTEPYYLLTAWQATVAQAVTERVRITGSYGRQRLDYEALNRGSGTADGERVDNGTTIGAGVMLFTASRKTSFGVTIDYAQRDSRVLSRKYDGMRYGAIVLYAF